MQIDHSEAMIELTSEEVDYFLGAKEVPTDLLSVEVDDPKGSFTFTYKSFSDRVEHHAKEIHHETGRSVLIFNSEGDTIATYNERGLEMQK